MYFGAGSDAGTLATGGLDAVTRELTAHVDGSRHLFRMIQECNNRNRLGYRDGIVV
jgi:hypothetical protein